ncbi:MAG: hypothetical protein ACI81R_002339 [Bradymonadia bacterium]|jgi:hypothetical protein
MNPLYTPEENQARAAMLAGRLNLTELAGNGDRQVVVAPAALSRATAAATRSFQLSVEIPPKSKLRGMSATIRLLRFDDWEDDTVFAPSTDEQQSGGFNPLDFIEVKLMRRNRALTRGNDDFVPLSLLVAHPEWFVEVFEQQEKLTFEGRVAESVSVMDGLYVSWMVDL